MSLTMDFTSGADGSLKPRVLRGSARIGSYSKVSLSGGGICTTLGSILVDLFQEIVLAQVNSILRDAFVPIVNGVLAGFQFPTTFPLPYIPGLEQKVKLLNNTIARDGSVADFDPFFLYRGTQLNNACRGQEGRQSRVPVASIRGRSGRPLVFCQRCG